MTDVRHARGQQGEELAAAHFERLGYEVLARNHRTRYGELDLVVCDGESLVFVEVKTRREGSGSPWDNLHDLKRSQVRRMAIAWLSSVRNRPRGDLRFDAVGIVLDARGELVSLDHLEAAF
jgi:putative endonuclease